jgi:hypothetical protein
LQTAFKAEDQAIGVLLIMTRQENNLQLAQIEEDLRLDDLESNRRLDWLASSWADPVDFRRFLMQTLDRRTGGYSASRIGKHYSFYRDVFQRNRNNSSPALCWYDANQTLQEVGYLQLDARVTQRAFAWHTQGLVPGQNLAVIRNVGIDLAIDLLAALKLGAVFTLIQPQGKAYLQRRLSILNPDHISLEEGARPQLVSSWNPRVLDSRADTVSVNDEVADWFFYPSEKAVIQCFDPCMSGLSALTDVSAESFYLGAIRDGLIGLGLKRGSLYATAGLDAMQIQPFLLMAGFLCGATFLFLDPGQIEEQPDLLCRLTFKAFGIGSEVRDLLLDRPQDIGSSWETWFRDPAESNDLALWQSLVRRNHLETSFAFNLKWLPSYGGCALHSRKRKGIPHLDVFPAPGAYFERDQTLASWGSMQPTLALIDDTAEILCPFILAQNGAAYLWAGNPEGYSRGRYEPIEEIMVTLVPLQQRYQVIFSLFSAADMAHGVAGGLVLFVFNGQQRELDQAKLKQQIHSLLFSELGPLNVPWRIEFIPLFPRFNTEGSVDALWLRQAYLSGELQRSGQEEVALAVNDLKLCLEVK